MFKIAFSLFCNINQSACRTLDWVLINWEDFDCVLYMCHREFPMRKKIVNMPYLKIRFLNGKIFSQSLECSSILIFRQQLPFLKLFLSVSQSESAQRLGKKSQFFQKITKWSAKCCWLDWYAQIIMVQRNNIWKFQWPAVFQQTPGGWESSDWLALLHFDGHQTNWYRVSNITYNVWRIGTFVLITLQ